MDISNLANKFYIVWKAKKILRKPKHAMTMIYDRNGSDVLFRYIKKDEVEVLDVRGETINLYVLLKCALSLNISISNYQRIYISIVKPSVIITFIDNDSRFYNLKNEYPNITTIFVQNGLRSDHVSMLGGINKKSTNSINHVDYMLTFGANIGKKYCEYIEGQVIPVGSILNNLCEIKKCNNDKSIVFISQFSANPDNTTHRINIGKRHVDFDEFYLAEKILIKYLVEYCDSNKLLFKIYGRSTAATKEEYDFFQSLIGDKEWQFIPGGDIKYSYELIDRASYVFGIDSTLLYESLARGNKTGVFSVRGNILSDLSRNFGWPGKLPDNGPFWTNCPDELEFKRVLDYVTSVNDVDWEKTKNDYVHDLMEYDSGNTRFINLLQKLDVQLNDHYKYYV